MSVETSLNTQAKKTASLTPLRDSTDEKAEARKDLLRKGKFEKLIALGTSPDNDPRLRTTASFRVTTEGQTDQCTIIRTATGYTVKVFLDLYGKAEDREEHLFYFDKKGKFKYVEIPHPETSKLPVNIEPSRLVDAALSKLGAHNLVK